MLCEEILALSKHKIDPRKITLVFDNKCPDCGFALQRVLQCEIAMVPIEMSQLMHPKIGDPTVLFESDPYRNKFEIGTANRVQTSSELTLTGIDQIDRTIKLRLGQFVVLHGRTAEELSPLICVRTTLPEPQGLDSDVIFLDGANMFDAYAIANYAIRYQLNPEKTLARIHLSRAFTYHQLSTLINERLPHAISLFKAKLVVISDITALYCDPDVTKQNEQESLDVFRRDVRTLTAIAEKNRTLIIATSLQLRNSQMNTILLQTVPVSIKLNGHNSFTQLILTRHPFAPQFKTRIFRDKQTLESYI
jgi:hypothetical protein